MAFIATREQYLRQLLHAEVMFEKVRSASIMQAWLDGYEVIEFQNTILIQEKE